MISKRKIKSKMRKTKGAKFINTVSKAYNQQKDKLSYIQY